MQSSAQSMEKITCLPTRNHTWQAQKGEGRGGGERRERGKGRATLPLFLPNPFSLFAPFYSYLEFHSD